MADINWTNKLPNEVPVNLSKLEEYCIGKLKQNANDPKVIDCINSNMSHFSIDLSEYFTWPNMTDKVKTDVSEYFKWSENIDYSLLFPKTIIFESDWPNLVDWKIVLTVWEIFSWDSWIRWFAYEQIWWNYTVLLVKSNNITWIVESKILVDVSKIFTDEIVNRKVDNYLLQWMLKDNFSPRAAEYMHEKYWDFSDWVLVDHYKDYLKTDWKSGYSSKVMEWVFLGKFTVAELSLIKGKSLSNLEAEQIVDKLK